MSWLMETSLLPSVDGLTLLFAKALMILLLGSLLANDVGFSSAAVRHRARLATLFSLIALPLLAAVAPRWELPFFSASSTGPAAGPSGPFGWLLFTAIAFYCCGVCWRMLRLFADIAVLVAITLRSNPAPQEWRDLLRELAPQQRIPIRCTSATDSPLTWGKLWPVILLPRDSSMTRPEMRMVLRHELGHIQRGDWLAHLLGQLVGALYWPIPGLRHTIAQLSLESEQACDNFVLATEPSAPDYAALLVAQARGHQLRAAVALSRQHELALRIRNICSARVDHSVISTGWAWLIPLCLVLVLPLSGMQLGSRLPPSNPAVTDDSLRIWRTDSQGQTASPLVAPSLPDRLPLPATTPVLPFQTVDPLRLAGPARGAVFTVALSPLTAAPATSILLPTLQILGTNKVPAYPAAAKRRQIEGLVVARFDIDDQGIPTHLRIVRAEPAGVFESSVMEALKKQRYSPLQLHGQPATLRDLEMTFRFELREPPAQLRPP